MRYLLATIAILATLVPSLAREPIRRSRVAVKAPPWEAFLGNDPVRPNPYDVWQAYAVDHYGRFRPRVIEFPGDARYVHDGSPYPWTVLYPQNTARVTSPPAPVSEGSRPSIIRIVGYASSGVSP